MRILAALFFGFATFTLVFLGVICLAQSIENIVRAAIYEAAGDADPFKLTVQANPRPHVTPRQRARWRHLNEDLDGRSPHQR